MNTHQEPAKLDECEWKPFPSTVFKDTIVRIIVGPDKSRFDISKGLLSHYSGYFRGAFSRKFSESLKRECILTDVEPDTFTYVLRWIYGGFQSLSEAVDDDFMGMDEICCRTWIVADRLLMPALQNSITNHIISQFDNINAVPVVDCKDLEAIWEQIAQNSCLRSMLLDLFYSLSLEDMEEFRALNLPKTILCDILDRNSLFTNLSATDAACKYHVHEKKKQSKDNVYP